MSMRRYFGNVFVLLYLHCRMIATAIKGEEVPETLEGSAIKSKDSAKKRACE